MRLEQRLGLLGRNLFRGERQVRVDQLPHPGAQALEAFGIRLERRTAGPPLAQLAVQAAGQGVLDHEHLAREDVAHGVLQQEAQRTDVRPPPVRVVIPDERDFVREEDIETQFLEFVVHQGGEHGVPLAGLRVDGFGALLPGEVQEVGPDLHAEFPAVVLAENVDHHIANLRKNTRVFFLFRR